MGGHPEDPVAPTIGRIVHFFTKDKQRQCNGQGEGPYPAIVLQTFSGSMANLKVMTYNGDYVVGSAMHYHEAADKVPVDDEPYQYWVWPPRG